MQFLYRAARVFADEGFGGLVRRTGRKLARLGTPVAPPPDLRAGVNAAVAEYHALCDAFPKRCRALGHTGIDEYYWYHTIDLGNGLITPGDYDFRDLVSSFGFPADMTGLRVLDVGSATGFFAFEFERRGADVTSVELPSLAAWDMVNAEREGIVRGIIEHHKADGPEQAYERHLDGPFRFCLRVLKSRVRRVYYPVYDLTLDKVGGEPFDLIYVGDVLMHLFSPLTALNALTSLCRGALMLTTEVPFDGPEDKPLMAFRGHLSREDGRTWWAPNRAWAECTLQRLGFGSVSVVGRYSGVARCIQAPFTREVVRAVRA